MTLLNLPVSLITAAGCALINFWLALRIGRVRRAERIDVGDGGSERLLRRMRAQANFVEYAPFVILLVLALELTRGPSGWLWAVSVVFLMGRVLHGLGMDGGSARIGRIVGTATTMLTMVGLAIWAIVAVYQGGTAPAVPTIEAVPAAG